MSGDVEILLTRHFLKRLEERSAMISANIVPALLDLARAGDRYFAAGLDVMGTTCSKRGTPSAKIVARLYENESGRRLMARTIMPADYKHNVGSVVRTIDVGYIGPNRFAGVEAPKAPAVEKRSDKLENLLCALRREIRGQEKALRKARPHMRGAVFARHTDRIERAAEDVRQQAKREGIEVDPPIGTSSRRTSSSINTTPDGDTR